MTAATLMKFFQVSVLASKLYTFRNVLNISRYAYLLKFIIGFMLVTVAANIAVLE